MLSPSMYSPPRSLHRSIWIVHYWKQCCRSSSDSLFMSSFAFAFTASTYLNVVPFNADFIYGNKKSHVGLGQVSAVDVPTWWSCASSKTSWQTGHCVLAHCLGEEPMRRSSSFQVFFFSPIHEGLSEPPCSRHGWLSDLQAPNPCEQSLGCRKNDHHFFKFGFALLCFLLCWWTGALPLHGLALTFWVVLKKTMIHHKLLHSLKVLGLFNILKNVSTNVHSN